MARLGDCEHSERNLICPVCDREAEEERRKAEERERIEERAAMFGYPGDEYQ